MVPLRAGGNQSSAAALTGAELVKAAVEEQPNSVGLTCLTRLPVRAPTSIEKENVEPRCDADGAPRHAPCSISAVQPAAPRRRRP